MANTTVSPAVTKNACPECGGDVVWGKRASTVAYQGQKATVNVSGWWCNSCGEGILEGKELLVRERAFKELKAKVDGVLGPKQVARARQAIGLSQREAGKILGGGPRSFQKYESGKAAVSTPMSHLLRLLETDPSLIGVIKKEAIKISKTRSQRGGRARPMKAAAKKGRRH